MTSPGAPVTHHLGHIQHMGEIMCTTMVNLCRFSDTLNVPSCHRTRARHCLFLQFLSDHDLPTRFLRCLICVRWNSVHKEFRAVSNTAPDRSDPCPTGQAGVAHTPHRQAHQSHVRLSAHVPHGTPRRLSQPDCRSSSSAHVASPNCPPHILSAGSTRPPMDHLGRDPSPSLQRSNVRTFCGRSALHLQHRQLLSSDE